MANTYGYQTKPSNIIIRRIFDVSVHLFTFRLDFFLFKQVTEEEEEAGGGKIDTDHTWCGFVIKRKIIAQNTQHTCMHHTNKHAQTEYFNRFIRSLALFLRCFPLIFVLFFNYNNYSVVSRFFRKSYSNLVHTKLIHHVYITFFSPSLSLSLCFAYQLDKRERERD